jgi:cytochrome c-type biogenesis protein CcmH
MRRVLVCLFFFLAMGIFANVALAQGEQPPTDDQVNQIAKNLYCPVCENIPLDVCPTAACEQWRQVIADKLAAGWSEQQIYDYFVEQYGDRVLATPPARGLNWLIYVIPPLALLSGVLILGQVLRRAKTRTKANTEPIVSLSSDYEERIEEELKKRR